MLTKIHIIIYFHISLLHWRTGLQWVILLLLSILGTFPNMIISGVFLNEYLAGISCRDKCQSEMRSYGSGSRFSKGVLTSEGNSIGIT